MLLEFEQVLCRQWVPCTVGSMTNEERKRIVKEMLAEGRSLSEIQDHLRKEKNDSITYMELRLLLSEMPEVKLPEKETPKTAPAQEAKPAESVAGKLSISVDQMPAPGTMLSGYARFSSGAKAHWFLDQMGRLGIEPELGSSKPTQKDMQEFSAELKRMLRQEPM
jgi:DNA-binding transcriptional MerR regulator